MKQLKTLVGYELRKIWGKWLTCGTALALLLFCGVDATALLWTGGSASSVPAEYAAGVAASWTISRLHTVVSLLPLGIAVLLCGSFAEGGRHGVGPLLCAAKLSRGPLVLSKILAGALSSMGLAAVLVGEVAILEATMFGGGMGLHTPAQTYWPDCSLVISTAGVLLCTAGLVLLYAMLYSGLVMAVSALTGSAIAALTMGFLGEMGLIFLEGWGDAMAWWMNLMPFRLLSGQALETVLPGPLNPFQAGFLLYGGIAGILLGLCWPMWLRWIVARR